jgi:hypothetical protein
MRKYRANAHAPARITLSSSAPCNVAAEMPEATGSRISLEIRHDRVYEPEGGGLGVDKDAHPLDARSSTPDTTLQASRFHPPMNTATCFGSVASAQS